MNKNQFENKIRKDLSEGRYNILNKIFEDTNIYIKKVNSPFDVYEEDRVGGGTTVSSNGKNIKKGETKVEDCKGRRTDHFWFFSAENATYSIEIEHDDGHTTDVYLNFTEEGKEELIRELVEKYWDEED